MFPKESDEDEATVQQQYDKMTKVLEVVNNKVPVHSLRRKSNKKSFGLVQKFRTSLTNEEHIERYTETIGMKKTTEDGENRRKQNKMKSIEEACSEAAEAAKMGSV